VVAEGVIAAILALHGYPSEEPVRGTEYEESAESLNDAISELTSSIADDSHWEGAAAEAYNDLLEQLITQLQTMSEADLRIDETVADEAEGVRNARYAIEAAAGAVAIAIPIALALPPAVPYEFQATVAAITVSTPAATAITMGMVAGGCAGTISEQTAIYNAAATAAQPASGSADDTSMTCPSTRGISTSSLAS
jgi:uncharacterized protein YukE